MSRPDFGPVTIFQALYAGLSWHSNCFLGFSCHAVCRYICNQYVQVLYLYCATELPRQLIKYECLIPYLEFLIDGNCSAAREFTAATNSQGLLLLLFWDPIFQSTGLSLSLVSLDLLPCPPDGTFQGPLCPTPVSVYFSVLFLVFKTSLSCHVDLC